MITGKIKYVFLLLLLLLSSCSLLGGGDKAGQAGLSDGPPATVLSAAMEDIRLGEEARGTQGLLLIRESYKGTTWAVRAAFVLGLRELESGGDKAVLYLNEARSLGEIRPYVLLYLARAFSVQGKLSDAVRSYTALLGEYPEFAYRGRALYESALVLEQMGRDKEAKIVLREFIGRYPRSDKAGEALMKSARLEMASGSYAQARADIKTLIIKHPGKRPARQATQLIKENRDLKAIILTKDESCGRATALFSSYLYSEAVGALQGLVSADSTACAGKAEPLLVETLFRLKRYGEAELILKQRLRRIRKKNNKNSYKERSSLLLLATVYLREGDGEDKVRGFLKTVKALSEKFPDSSEARRALFMEGGYYEGADKRGQAISIYERILRSGKVSSEAAWRKAWLEYRMGRYTDAYKTLSLFKGKLKAANRRKFAYWRGRALEKADLKARAREEYAKACESRMPGYYCYMAQKRIIPYNDGEGSFTPVWAEGGEPGPLVAEGLEEGELRVAMVLLSTGLTNEAALEADKALKAQAPNRDMVFNLMRAFYTAGDYYHAIKVYDSYFGLLTRDNEAIAPELLRVAFPMKVVEYISAKGLAGKADPLLVAAVMREESSYDPDTISRTGAVGLMQVMPSTAEFIAKASRSIPRDSYNLSDPDTNIRMGAWYLAYLWQKTSGNPALTVAGYNAGLNSVRRWQKRFPLEEDEFIESIPYRETRRYTKKVLKSYLAFQSLAVGRRPLLAYEPQTKGRSE